MALVVRARRDHLPVRCDQNEVIAHTGLMRTSKRAAMADPSLLETCTPLSRRAYPASSRSHDHDSGHPQARMSRRGVARTRVASTSPTAAPAATSEGYCAPLWTRSIATNVIGTAHVAPAHGQERDGSRERDGGSRVPGGKGGAVRPVLEIVVRNPLLRRPTPLHELFRDPVGEQLRRCHAHDPDGCGLPTPPSAAGRHNRGGGPPQLCVLGRFLDRRQRASLSRVGDGQDRERARGGADHDHRRDVTAGDGTDDAVVLAIWLGVSERVFLRVDETDRELLTRTVGELLVDVEDVGREAEPVGYAAPRPGSRSPR